MHTVIINLQTMNRLKIKEITYNYTIKGVVRPEGQKSNLFRIILVKTFTLILMNGFQNTLVEMLSLVRQRFIKKIHMNNILKDVVKL